MSLCLASFFCFDLIWCDPPNEGGRFGMRFIAGGASLVMLLVPWLLLLLVLLVRLLLFLLLLQPLLCRACEHLACVRSVLGPLVPSPRVFQTCFCKPFKVLLVTPSSHCRSSSLVPGVKVMIVRYMCVYTTMVTRLRYMVRKWKW